MAFLDLTTWTKTVVFWGYITLWVTFSLFIYGFRKQRHNANFTIVTTLIEATKLLLSMFLYIKDDHSTMKTTTKELIPIFIRYTIPAVLYAVFNNLHYVILSLTDPSTQSVLGNIRVILTAILWRFVFSKTIPLHKWDALGMITLGCGIKGYAAWDESNESSSSSSHLNVFVISLILFQLSCSTTAGIYMEYMLKGYKHVSINLQQCFMYINCILGNFLIMMIFHSRNDAGNSSVRNTTASSSSSTSVSLSSSSSTITELKSILFDPMSILLILIGSATGVSTGYFLRHLDSIRKTIATSIELVAIPFVSMALFGTDIGLETIIAVVLVAYGTFLYSKKVTTKLDKEDVDDVTHEGETMVLPIQKLPSKKNKRKTVISSPLDFMDFITPTSLAFFLLTLLPYILLYIQPSPVNDLHSIPTVTNCTCAKWDQAKYKFDTHAWPNTMNVGCILIACIVIFYHTNLSSSSSSKTFANLFLFFNVVLPIVLYLFFHSYRSGYASMMVIICSIDLLLYVVLLLNGKKKYPILLRCIVVLLLWSIIPLLAITSWFVCRIQQELPR